MSTILLEREPGLIIPGTREFDKRYFPRWEVNKRVEFESRGGAVLRSYTRDLSLDGASIFVFGDPPEQHRIQLRIYLAEKEGFEARGRVLWVKLEPTHTLFGLAFENLRKKAQELITRHAFEVRKDPRLAEY